MIATTLSEYLSEYGNELAGKVETVFEPLHVPGRDPLPPMDFVRPPLPAQSHVIAASVKTLRRDGVIWVAAKMGTGKSFMGAAVADLEAAGRPYRSIVMCPPHLTEKWQREIENTIRGANVRIIQRYTDLVTMAAYRPKRQGPEWMVLSSSTAKLGNPWKPAYVRRMEDGLPRCPKCHAVIYDGLKEDEVGARMPMPHKKLASRQRKCEQCKEPLYQWFSQYDRWPVSTYIHRRMRGMFRHLVVDEMHCAKGEQTAIARSLGQLSSSCRYTIGLTGTVMGGYATNMHGLLWRTSPRTLVEAGEEFEARTQFAARYGRIERVTTERCQSVSNRMSQGSTRNSTSTRERPGVMPALFADHLIDKAVFLSLDEVAADLPEQIETVFSADLDPEIQPYYQDMESAFKMHVGGMMRSKSGRRAMSQMINLLMGYPDRPYGWDAIGYEDEGSWVTVCIPPNLDRERLRPKERQMLNSVIREVGERRQVWIFVQMTQKRDIQSRLAQLLRERGMRVEIMRSQAVKTKDRERWIAQKGKHCDVIISHPGLVETGLDLFDMKAGHNFCSLLWYQTGYSICTLRQASARALRIGQTRECRVGYQYYAGTIQEKAMNLMCQKLVASESIEGKFSEGGLASLQDDTESMTVALAKSLAESIDDTAGIRAWERLKSGGQAA